MNSRYTNRVAALRGAIFITMLLFLVCGSARAHTHSYDNEAQLIGAAIVSPEAGRLVIKEVVQFCSANSPLTRPAAQTAFEAWIDRHKQYLEHSAGYRDAAKQMASDPATAERQRAGLKKMLETDFPRLVASKVEAAVEPLRVAKENGYGEELCFDYFSAVATGKFDLRTNDPQLTEFYDKIAPRK